VKPEQAETIALQAIAYIGANEYALNALMAQSGMGPDDLRENLTDPAFLAGIMDFLLADEGNLLAFCEEINCQPELIVTGRRALPGAENLWDG